MYDRSATGGAEGGEADAVCAAAGTGAGGGVVGLDALTWERDLASSMTAIFTFRHQGVPLMRSSSAIALWCMVVSVGIQGDG